MNALVIGRLARPLVLVSLLIAAADARANVISFGSQEFTPYNVNADGAASVVDGALVIVGGNNGSGNPGTTDLIATAPADGGLVTFRYLFTTADIDPITGDTFDSAGYLVGDSFYPFLPLFFPAPLQTTFPVAPGQAYGFRVETLDNIGEPGVLTISDFQIGSSSVPEPRLGLLVAAAGAVCAAFSRLRRSVLKKAARVLACAAMAVAVCGLAQAQEQLFFKGRNATGELALKPGTATQAVAIKSLAASSPLAKVKVPDAKHAPQFRRSVTTTRLLAAQTLLGPALIPGLSVANSTSDFSFDGLNHGDQRKANNGNQWSIEPPSGQVAVGKEYILEGVNDAIQVYGRASGAPLLPKVLSTNELFGLLPAIDRNTGVNGPYLTDMRVFYDHDIDRWFVMQRGQDNDAAGNLLPSSHLYLAVSQTREPTGKYNVYVMDTTSKDFPKCPCIADYPDIGADKYSVNISFDLYSYYLNNSHAGARIVSISKAGLASGANTPVAWDFPLPLTTLFEGAIRPAKTPPNASYFTASGGLQYFLSSNAAKPSDNQFALWALVNTASLATAPNLTLYERIIPGVPYSYPGDVGQKPGPNPLGSDPNEYFPPRPLAVIDGGRDSRILSLVYSGGRLYTTFATQAYDEGGTSVVGGGYAILSPTFRSGIIAAPVLRAGTLVVKNNHVLRPAVAVNPQGKGAIAFTLAGPDYYPSAAFVPIETFSTATTARVAGIGMVPEDGFTGYDPDPLSGMVLPARWGDYSAAVATDDGSIWMLGEYTPSLFRESGNENWYAHWGTRVMRYIP